MQTEKKSLASDEITWLIHLDEQASNHWLEMINEGIASSLSSTEVTKLITSFFAKLSDLAIDSNRIFLLSDSKELIAKLGSLNLLNKISILEASSDVTALKNLFANGAKHIAYFDSFFCLWDVTETTTLFQIHSQYRADYSYAENLPPGMSPVFFNSSLFEAGELANLNLDQLQMPLRQLIEKNINKFHVEVHFAEPDLRIYRLDFAGLDKRSLFKTAKVAALKGDNDNVYSTLSEILQSHSELLLSLPSYLEIELISDCDYACDFCPRQFIEVPSHQIQESQLKAIEDFLAVSFSDTTISLGGLGEPLQHDKAAVIIKRLLENNKIKNLVLETNGYYLDKIFDLIELDSMSKLILIININSLKAYEKLHGVELEKKEKVFNNLKSWISKIKPELLQNTYIQTLKIIENEEEVDLIVDYCDQKGISFLFQKYNRYINLMPERRVSDMTPLERSFCWHLRRDLFIRANGDISFCKQDVKNTATRGNISETSIVDIYTRQSQDFKETMRENINLKMDCSACDEYFTFNM